MDPARISAGNFQRRRRWEGGAESHTQDRAAPAPGGPRGQGEEGQNAERERRPANTPPHSHHLPDGSSLNPDEKLHKHQTHSAQVGKEHGAPPGGVEFSKRPPRNKAPVRHQSGRQRRQSVRRGGGGESRTPGNAQSSRALGNPAPGVGLLGPEGSRRSPPAGADGRCTTLAGRTLVPQTRGSQL